jgi:hypothetical protein
VEGRPSGGAGPPWVRAGAASVATSLFAASSSASSVGLDVASSLDVAAPSGADLEWVLHP